MSQLATAEPRFRRWIDATAELVQLPSWTIHGERYLPGELLEAHILQETSGKPNQRRYEPHLDVQADGDRPGLDDGLTEDDASWGALQVLGSNVRARFGVPRGTPMRFDPLFFAPLGIALGLLEFLDWLKGVQGDVGRALARFNAGGRGDRLQPDGRMTNQVYVDAVEAKAVFVRSDRLVTNWAHSGEDG